MTSLIFRTATTLGMSLGLSLLLLNPPQALALEKYGRPLPSMDDPNGREAEESLFAGYRNRVRCGHTAVATSPHDGEGNNVGCARRSGDELFLAGSGENRAIFGR